MRAIKSLTAENSGLSKEFNERNFALVKYKDAKGEFRTSYALTHDGFTMLIMGFTGAKAMKFKEWYINRFNEMQEQLSYLLKARDDAPRLTNALLAKGKNEWYHYSNEFNMINSLVLGMSTKKFRELNNISKGDSIRPFLTSGQIKLIDEIQLYDSVLIDMVDDFKTRKAILKTKFIDEE